MAHRNQTRNLIVEAADDLFYRQGFGDTSFADIAGAVQISRGNFYHHFKTKDELLKAVIAHRLQKAEQWLGQWEAENHNPVDRIRCFIHILIMNRAKIKRYGCPLGSLSSELDKLDHAARPQARKLFTLYRRWLRRQFEQLGHGDDADRLAMHLLARSQGVATLAASYRDSRFIEDEVESMNQWLLGLARTPTDKTGHVVTGV